MSEPTTARGRGGAQNILAAFVLAALVFTLGVNLLPSARVRSSIEFQLAGARPNQLSREIASIDESFGEKMPDGDIYLHFVGFEANDPGDDYFVMRHYFRGRYAAFPRRVYVSTEALEIRNSTQLLTANRKPDDAWLAENDISYTVTITNLDNRRGERRSKIRRVVTKAADAATAP